MTDDNVISFSEKWAAANEARQLGISPEMVASLVEILGEAIENMTATGATGRQIEWLLRYSKHIDWQAIGDISAATLARRIFDHESIVEDSLGPSVISMLNTGVSERRIAAGLRKMASELEGSEGST